MNTKREEAIGRRSPRSEIYQESLSKEEGDKGEQSLEGMRKSTFEW